MTTDQLREALDILNDEERMVDWDDQWDLLPEIEPADTHLVPLLLETLRQPAIESGKHLVALNALLRIAPVTPEAVAAFAEHVSDRNEPVRGDAIEALRCYGHVNLPAAVPALAHAAKHWDGFVSNHVKAFASLVHLVGMWQAVAAVKSVH